MSDRIIAQQMAEAILPFVRQLGIPPDRWVSVSFNVRGNGRAITSASFCGLSVVALPRDSSQGVKP
jgi:hypothetical protein